jgi:L-xylulokinase
VFLEASASSQLPVRFEVVAGPVRLSGNSLIATASGRATVRAVLEGIIFNHRTHVDALRAGFSVREARLTGGVARNPAFAQMFADILGMPVTTSQTEEAAAWGAALCAGAAVGLYASPLHDPRDMSLLGQTYTPDPTRAASYEKRFQLYQKIINVIAPLWPEIEALVE